MAEPTGTRQHSEPSDEPLDLFLAGTLFFDLVFTGLPADPQPGTEVWAAGMGSLPGGVANLAVAAARLGLCTGLAAAIGDDAYGTWNAQVLGEQEGIDLSHSRVVPGWHTPVTVSLSTHGDRSMITHGDRLPMRTSELVGDPPASRAVFADLGLDLGLELERGGAPGEPWWRTAARRGSLVFADLGWDASGDWSAATLAQLDGCHAFLPNHVEAMAYTRTDSAEDAVKALAERVPLAVVTCGSGGALAIDGSTGETARVPSVPVNPFDSTGAGDVFAAAMITGTLREWPLADRLAFATLCAALAVEEFGGSLASPGWADIASWRAKILREAQHDEARAAIAERFAFLDGPLSTGTPPPPRRASATFKLPHVPRPHPDSRQ
ncbi:MULTISPECIES: carbohydrate kinase family protein [unclassified Leucobacter]|uniref:carbohydrate kinase family protein n=1 Tax=unclassified Leucobacter TaxID=2621730 RepID=UPI00165D7928|nr:carbohydrate kinase family protein [Leucobacter sp. cx-87]